RGAEQSQSGGGGEQHAELQQCMPLFSSTSSPFPISTASPPLPIFLLCLIDCFPSLFSPLPFLSPLLSSLIFSPTSRLSFPLVSCSLLSFIPLTLPPPFLSISPLVLLPPLLLFPFPLPSSPLFPFPPPTLLLSTFPLPPLPLSLFPSPSSPSLPFPSPSSPSLPSPCPSSPSPSSPSP
ncbi:unnamed protein product, partial [Closterium sp. NIES-65]